MIIEYEGNEYETVINKPIIKGDLYFDCMVHEIRVCESYICFDPWSLKMVLKEKKSENEKKD